MVGRSIQPLRGNYSGVSMNYWGVMVRFLKKVMAAYLTFWARFVLAEHRPRIVAITGSVGKTTTKEAIAAVLMHPAALPIIGPAGKSENSLNSELGLPMAVLRFDRSPETSWLGWLWLAMIVPFQTLAYLTVRAYPTVLVLEYAADRPGDIGRLTRLAPPEVAVVTAVGPAHLEQLGSVERVAREKGQLIRAVAPTGLAILARDNSHVAAMSRLTAARTVMVSGRGIELAQNIARATADYFGISRKHADEALRDFQSLKGRMDIQTVGRFVVIDDTYNANPLSMELGLDTLAEISPSARRIAYLGEMKELGTHSRVYHRELGTYARPKCDVLIGVGPLTKEYRPDIWYATSQDAAAAIGDIIEPGDAVLVKGSRSVHMEHVVAAIKHLAKE